MVLQRILDGETPHRIRGRAPISVWMKHIACSFRNALLVEFAQLECIDCIFHSNYIIAVMKGDLLHMVFKVGTDPIWYSLLPTWLHLRKQTDTFQWEVSSPASRYFQVYQNRPCAFISIANIFLNLIYCLSEQFEHCFRGENWDLNLSLSDSGRQNK